MAVIGGRVVDPAVDTLAANRAQQAAIDAREEAARRRNQAERDAQDAARTAATIPSYSSTPPPSGIVAGISAPAYEQQQQATLEARLSAQALRDRAALNEASFTKRLAQLSSTGGASAPRVEGSPLAGNEAAARSAAFARAKDRAGQTALASLTALQNVLGQRGMFGSSEEARLTQGGLQGGADVLNEFTRDELMTDLNRAAELSDRAYSGDITQRGQDLAARQSLLALMTSSGLY